MIIIMFWDITRRGLVDNLPTFRDNLLVTLQVSSSPRSLELLDPWWQDQQVLPKCRWPPINYKNTPTYAALTSQKSESLNYIAVESRYLQILNLSVMHHLVYVKHDESGQVPNAKRALLLVRNKFNLVTLAQLRPQQWACVSWQYIN